MKKFLTILAFLFLSLAINATEYYVATPANGGKDTNTGLVGFPFATINYASLHVPAGTNTIHIGAGVFNEGINRVKFAEGVTLVGAGIIPPVTEVISSYVGDSLTLGSFVFSSSVQGTNGNQSVSNIWFDGSSTIAGSAISVERRSNISIFNCKFTNFKYSAIAMIGGADMITEPTIYATGNQIYNDTINNCTGYYGGSSRGAIEIVGQSGIKIYNNYFNQKQRVVGNEALIQGVGTFNKLMDVHDNYVNKLLLTNVNMPTDFHLQATSPAINAGASLPTMTTDIGGNPIKNPPDIGAYGYYAVVPTVSTATVTNISNTTATSGRLFVADGGSNIAMSGVCWNKTGNPTISDSHTNDGSISPFGVPNIISNITGLVQGTLYHVRAYATNATGTGYGSDLTFTTSGSGSILVTGLFINTIPVNSIHTISTYHGTLQLGVTSVIPSNATNQTVTWSVTNGTGSGSITSSGLFTATTNGDAVVYATANDGSGVRDNFIITMSNQIVITYPTVTTAVVTNIAQTTVTTGGNVTADGGATVSIKGVCWSTNVNPTIANSLTNDGTGTGVFTSSLIGLSANTLYHVRAYATNSAGTAYGNDLTFTTLAVVAVLPTVTTTVITNIAQTTATGGGNVTSDGGAPVTAYGVCWDMSGSPALDNVHTTDGTGTGVFTSNITGLNSNTIYYVKAYATNSVGTAYGARVQFTTLIIPVLPTVTTTVITNIAQTTATGGGNVTSDGGATVTLKGVCWSTAINPTTVDSHSTDGTGTGTYTSSIYSLIANTTYHARAYATNSVGTVYGNDISFTTLPIPAVLPTVTTAIITGIGTTTATGGGNVTADGGANVTAKGICYNLTSYPSLISPHTNDGTGTGSFVSSMTGLLANTIYHARAYAINSVGTAYGADVQFTTLSIPVVVLPTVTTTILTAITQTTAISGGNVTADGGGTVTFKGVCWSTTVNPTTANSLTNDGTGTGIYVSSITGLTPSTLYHVRAYATNSVGTAYGNDISFTTLNNSVLATVYTTTVTNIAKTTARSGGSITSDGGASVTARGVCWNTSGNPTTANFLTNDGSGTGIFISNMTGMIKSTNYHLRAYATNSAGTAYGVDVPFRTDDVPTVITAATTNKLQTSVTSGGNVTNDDSLAVTAKGVCWAKIINPIVDSLHTVDGAGLGKYVSQITGLTPNSRYHVRAYATNAAGTGYGVDYLFTTATNPIVIPTLITGVSSTITWTTQFVFGGTGGSTIKLVCTGNITNTGGSPITAKGICWSTSLNSTIANYYAYDNTPNTGIGIFTVNIGALSPHTLYHIRAFAKNAAGIAYGNDIPVTTPDYLIQGN
jgi:hypothetical protein